MATRAGAEVEQAVEVAVNVTREELTKEANAKQEELIAKHKAQLSKLIAGISDSDAAHAARHKALEDRLRQANAALAMGLDGLTGHMGLVS